MKFSAKNFVEHEFHCRVLFIRYALPFFSFSSISLAGGIQARSKFVEKFAESLLLKLLCRFDLNFGMLVNKIT